MPYYNQLYNSEKLKFNPFMNADYIDTHNQQSEGSDNLSSDQSATFTNNTNRDVSNVHEDHETSVTNRDLSRNTTGDKGVQLSGDDTNTESGSIELEKEGAEMVKDTQPANFSTLVKEADTPIGGVGGSGNIGSAVGDNSGYLSKITETVSNATSSDHRKSGFTSTSYGKYYKTLDGANEVIDQPRKDTTTFKSHKNKTDYGKREDTDYTDNVSETDDTRTQTDQNGSYHTDDDTVATGRSNTNQLDARTTKDKQDYFGKVFGKVGSETYSEMLMKFRDTFLNIDMMVIKELEPLFMLIW